MTGVLHIGAPTRDPLLRAKLYAKFSAHMQPEVDFDLNFLPDYPEERFEAFAKTNNLSFPSIDHGRVSFEGLYARATCISLTMLHWRQVGAVFWIERGNVALNSEQPSIWVYALSIATMENGAARTAAPIIATALDIRAEATKIAYDYLVDAGVCWYHDTRRI